MKEKNQNTGEAKLHEVQSLFAEWRSKKKRREPIPEKLWQQAGQLAKHYSIGKIASVLKLNHHSLKIKTDLSDKKTAADITPGQNFIEVALKDSAGNNNCNMELENQLGEKIRFSFRHDTASEYLDFVKSFLTRK